MSHAALTAKYRPQTFAQVAGQDTLKAILSRASLEQRVAPAYLFSGTRGVGKTTLARIFAKALNCRTAPTAEPCNTCDQCRAITAGNAVDVVEIDGASNRGIDDVRRLKEVVGYAPMEGTYKIFIIDEAHMLSREAFNALLKTLEEPPARVTFVMATTEPHKFPATIISRCQHYVFKRLPESGLVAHLKDVLTRENVDFEDGAVRLIARRGAGSVRDSMSLLGQVLALKEGGLSEESARSVLGLAGQEVFLRMLESFRTGDGLTLSRILREMLDQGLDMGFFLRELSSLWRNLFMLRQSGEAALPVVELPENEAQAFLTAASGFSLQHIHACWQMTLEGQRRVLTSLEPALALELLLLNLAMLPQLLSLEQISAISRKGGKPGEGSGGSPGQGGSSPASRSSSLRSSGQGAASHEASPQVETDKSGTRAPSPDKDLQEVQQVVNTDIPRRDEVRNGLTARPVKTMDNADARSRADALSDDEDPDEADIQAALREISRLDSVSAAASGSGFRAQSGVDALHGATSEPLSASGPADMDSGSGEPGASLRNEAARDEGHDPLPRWDTIFLLCAERDIKLWLVSLLRKVEAVCRGDRLVLEAHDDFVAERLCDAQVRQDLNDLLIAWCGRIPDLEVIAPNKPRKSREEVRAEVYDHPLVKEVEAHLGAYVVDYGQIRS